MHLIGSRTTHLDRVPVLAGEGVDRLLLEALLALGESLVPAESRKSIILIAARRGDAHFPTAMFAGLCVNRWRENRRYCLERLEEGRNNFRLCVHQLRSKRVGSKIRGSWLFRR